MLRQPISLCLSNSESQSARAGGRFVHEANGYTWLVTYLDVKARFTGKVFNLPNTFKEIIEVMALTIAVRTHSQSRCSAHQDPHRGTDSRVLGRPRRGA